MKNKKIIILLSKAKSIREVENLIYKLNFEFKYYLMQVLSVESDTVKFFYNIDANTFDIGFIDFGKWKNIDWNYILFKGEHK